MNKRAFSMIELVFVIVVLGILAGVAIPRLAATRDDAEYSKAIQNINILARDLSDYYISQGIPNIPILKGHSGSEMTADMGRFSWTPADLKAMTGIPLDGPKEKGVYVYNVGGEPCFTVWMNVVDFLRDKGEYYASQISRDILILKFKKIKTNTKNSCVMVQNSQLFNQYNEDIKDGGKVRLLNQKIYTEEGKDNYEYFAVVGGLIAGQDKGLFEDEIIEYTEDELERAKQSYGGNLTGLF